VLKKSVSARLTGSALFSRQILPALRISGIAGDLLNIFGKADVADQVSEGTGFCNGWPKKHSWRSAPASIEARSHWAESLAPLGGDRLSNFLLSRHLV
jgi:hypothetical protein